jgi:hypothetical protein
MTSQVELQAPTAVFLAQERDRILVSATTTLRRAHLGHYESVPEAELRRRLECLLDRLDEAVMTRDPAGTLSYARSLAQERFAAGCDLADVQVAINALEQAVWQRVFAQLDPSSYGEALRLVSTILGAAKDALAREYVSLAARTRTSSLDLRALVEGCALR